MFFMLTRGVRRGPVKWRSASKLPRGTPKNARALGMTGELLEDGVTVRISHTAMGHTVTGETRYAPPPGARRLTGLETVGDFVVTQWDAGRLALHSSDGTLLHADVASPGSGRLRWRRIPAAP
jgi:hypothetical protein